MTNCPNCGDYLREDIVRGPDGRIQLIDVELCRRSSCCKPPSSGTFSQSNTNGSWLGDVIDGVIDFFT